MLLLAVLVHLWEWRYMKAKSAGDEGSECHQHENRQVAWAEDSQLDFGAREQGDRVNYRHKLVIALGAGVLTALFHSSARPPHANYPRIF
jgi:hypothetical protein